MKELNKIHLAWFFTGASNIAAVTYTLYFLKNGLSQYEIGLLFSVFLITLALLEIPTGGIADTFGHKTSVFIGMIFHAFSFLALGLGSSFLTFLIAMVLAALGLALQSGAQSSLVYDILRKMRRLSDFEKVQGRMGAAFLVATIIFSPIGTVIYSVYPRAPYFIAALFIFISALAISRVRWEFKGDKPSVNIYITRMRKGFALVFTNHKLLAFTIITIALTMLRMVFNQNINLPYQVSIGVDVAHIGIVAALASAAGAYVMANTYKLSRWLGDINSLLIIVLVPSLTTLLLGAMSSLYAVIFIIVFTASHMARDPILARLAHHEVTGRERATMISTVSFASSMITGALFPLWGRVIDVTGLNTSLFLIGFFALLFGLLGVYIYIRATGKKHA